MAEGGSRLRDSNCFELIDGPIIPLSDPRQAPVTPQGIPRRHRAPFGHSGLAGGVDVGPEGPSLTSGPKLSALNHQLRLENKLIVGA